MFIIDVFTRDWERMGKSKLKFKHQSDKDKKKECSIVTISKRQLRTPVKIIVVFMTYLKIDRIPFFFLNKSIYRQLPSNIEICLSYFVGRLFPLLFRNTRRYTIVIICRCLVFSLSTHLFLFFFVASLFWLN